MEKTGLPEKTGKLVRTASIGTANPGGNQPRRFSNPRSFVQPPVRRRFAATDRTSGQLGFADLVPRSK
jgi:hypothetical protein